MYCIICACGPCIFCGFSLKNYLGIVYNETLYLVLETGKGYLDFKSKRDLRLPNFNTSFLGQLVFAFNYKPASYPINQKSDDRFRTHSVALNVTCHITVEGTEAMTVCLPLCSLPQRSFCLISTDQKRHLKLF